MNATRARDAADAGILAIVQLVVWEIPSANVSPDHLFSPSGERTHLDKPKLVVPRDDRRQTAITCLITPNATYPSGIVFQEPLLRLNFTQLAAQVWAAFPKSVAVQLGLFSQRKTRPNRNRLDCVARTNALNQRERLLEQEPCVQIIDR